MIKMQNGSSVLRADVLSAPDDSGSGYVLALTTTCEYVTWYVSKHWSQDEWHATSGQYFRQDLEAALSNFEERRHADLTLLCSTPALRVLDGRL